MIKDNVKKVLENIAQAAVLSGRKPEDITLVAVTKTVTAKEAQEVMDAGVLTLGENRVQSLLDKYEVLGDKPCWHLIGHLQTNKVKSIVGAVDMIQSVDSERVAKAIDTVSQTDGITTDILIEVNIGREPQKSGVLPEELPLLLEKVSTMQGLRVKGLMTVPPILDTEYEKRKIFSQMCRLFIDNRAKKLDNIDMQILSMGMSDDFYEAILEGATTVRVGSAIFGRRQY